MSVADVLPGGDDQLLVLIDASNVARCETWVDSLPHDDDTARMQRLVDAAVSWAASSGVACLLAFDGSGPLGAPATRELGASARVVTTGAASADSVLEKAAAQARKARRRHWLVSNDNDLRTTVAGGSELSIGADDFAAELVGASGQGAASSADPAPSTEREGSGASRLDSSLDDDTMSALERMRRGE